MMFYSRKHRRRYILAGLLLASLTQSAWADDEIRYFDHDSKTIVTVTANIEQDHIDGLRFRVGARTESIDVPVFDIVGVMYSVPGSLRLELGRARSEEQRSNALDLASSQRLAAIDRAIKDYQRLLVQGEQLASTGARRQWKFQIARLEVQAATEEPKRAKSAVEALTTCLQQDDSWYTNGAANLLARALTLEGNPEGAAQAFHRWMDGKGGSPEIKREFARQAVFWDILAKDFKPVSQAITALKATSPAGSGEALRLQGLELFLLAAGGKPEKALGELEILATGAKEDADRAYLWMIQGQCETLAGRDDQAFWAFLRVDQMCGDNQFARSRAVEQLMRLFENRCDWSKAAIYRARLWRDFAG
jgi:hypothetical protein